MNAVEVRDLTIRFGAFTAVDHISFAVERGEIFGFLGANGAGKTTTIRMLCGLLIPTSGEARVAGLGYEDGGRAIKAKVGYMSQRFTLYNDLSVGENLAFTASLHKMSSKALTERMVSLFAFLGFQPDPATLVRDLPGGIKQQLSLAAAILHDPDIVFLDEPTAGVAPAARERFWTLIRSLAAAGKTVFVTTHYMDEAEQCGRIALMRAGQIIALDTPAALKRLAFPEPLYEIDPGEASLEEGLRERLAKSPSLNDLQPYGTHFHASIADWPVWQIWAQAQHPPLHAREITPSLEDVFIRLVEGKNR